MRKGFFAVTGLEENACAHVVVSFGPALLIYNILMG